MTHTECNDTHEAALQAAYWTHKYFLALDASAELLMRGQSDSKANGMLVAKYQREAAAWSARAVELHTAAADE